MDFLFQFSTPPFQVLNNKNSKNVSFFSHIYTLKSVMHMGKIFKQHNQCLKSHWYWLSPCLHVDKRIIILVSLGEQSRINNSSRTRLSTPFTLPVDDDEGLIAAIACWVGVPLFVMMSKNQQ